MNNVFEKVCSGEIYPAEQIIPNDPDYRPLLHRISDTVEELKRNLSEEDAEKMDKLSDDYYEKCSMSSYENFSHGLKLGVMLMCEILELDE